VSAAEGPTPGCPFGTGRVPAPGASLKGEMKASERVRDSACGGSGADLLAYYGTFELRRALDLLTPGRRTAAGTDLVAAAPGTGGSWHGDLRVPGGDDRSALGGRRSRP
jgi:hypothetical protein